MTGSIIDGFTIAGARNGAGVYLGDYSDVSIVNCRIIDNDHYGIDLYDISFADVHNCLFTRNFDAGLSCRYLSGADVSWSVFDGDGYTGNGVSASTYSALAIVESSIEGHAGAAIAASAATVDVSRCVIQNNTGTGVVCSDSYLVVDHSLIASNTGEGLYMEYGSDLVLTNSVVRHNGADGLYLLQNVTSHIANNWIHNNGDGGQYGAGIFFKQHAPRPLVANNALYGNHTYGVEVSSYGSADPNIINCLIYGNEGDDLYWPSGTFNRVNYCLLQSQHSGTGNITGQAPGFVNPNDPDDLHIGPDSVCKNAGDPYGDYSGWTDIDGEPRVCYGVVDIGADEYYWSAADFDASGLVNFVDFAILRDTWQTSAGQGNYNDNCDLQDDDAIDMQDVALFCEQWLWEAGWAQSWTPLMAGDAFGGRMMSLMMDADPLELTSAGVVSPAAALLPADGVETLARRTKSTLPLPTLAESLRSRPDTLAERTSRFYEITPANTPTQAALAEMLGWLSQLWLDEDALKGLDQDALLKVMESLAEAVEGL